MIQMSNNNEANLCIGLSDLHFGSENCLYQTLDYTVGKMCKEIDMLNQRYNFNNVFICWVGDIVSGSHIYRNQFLESHMQKNEDIITFGAYMLHNIIRRLEDVLNIPTKNFIVVGTHEGLRKPLPHNYALGVARRLAQYGTEVKYGSKYYIVNIASGISKEPYNTLIYHGFGHSDYSSASPTLIRDLTGFHSQLATRKGIIVNRFLIGHSHHLEPNRTVIGIRFDCLGGFQKWPLKLSQHESGMLYYIYTEEDGCEVKALSGLKKQMEEEQDQGLHITNMRYVADMLLEAYDFELEKGILKKR